MVGGAEVTLSRAYMLEPPAYAPPGTDAVTAVVRAEVLLPQSERVQQHRRPGLRSRGIQRDDVARVCVPPDNLVTDDRWLRAPITSSS